MVDAVGRPALESVVRELLDAFETATTVFEANGDYATGGRPRGWCALMDELSRPCDHGDVKEAIETGRWSCRASCRQPALEAMRSGTPVEHECPGGLLVRAVPIRAVVRAHGGTIAVESSDPEGTTFTTHLPRR